MAELLTVQTCRRQRLYPPGLSLSWSMPENATFHE